MGLRVTLPAKPSSGWTTSDARYNVIPEIPESILSIGIWKPGVNGWNPNRDGVNHGGPE